MGLAEIQKALAKLYTDESLRARFVEDSLTVGRELGLSEDEAQGLAKIPPSQLSFFSDSLVSKRFGEVAKLMPLTRKALGKSFDNVWREFAQAYKPKGIKKHLDDAIAFAAYLQNDYREKMTGPAWIGDLIHFEQARLIFNEGQRRLLIRRFRFDVFDLLEKLNEGEIPAQVKELKLVGIWWRLIGGSKGKFRWLRF